MYYYQINGIPAASLLPDLPLEPAASSAAGREAPGLWLWRRDPESCPAVLRVTDPWQLAERPLDAAWLDPRRLGPAPELPPEIAAAARMQG